MDVAAHRLEARARDLERARSSAMGAARAAREGGAAGPLEVECHQDDEGDWISAAWRPHDPQEGQPDVFILRMHGQGRGAEPLDTEFNTSDQQGPTMASRLFGPAPLDLDKARGSAALRVRRARAEGARGPLEVDCFQGASGQWFCQAARPRDPREGPEDVFLLYPGSGKRARDAHDMGLTIFARGYY